MEFRSVSALPDNIPIEQIELADIPVNNTESFWVELVKKRIASNKNMIIIIVGEVGSGKSYSACRLAEVLDPTFDINRVAFSTPEFLELIQDFDRKQEAGEKIAGSVIVFDEIGVSLSNRRWYSDANVQFNYILQTFRRQNLIVIFTVPDFSFIDSQAQKLVNVVIQTKGILKTRRVVQLKPLNITINRLTGKKYNVYPRFWTSEGIVRLNLIEANIPSLKFRRNYEAKKHHFTSELIQAMKENYDVAKPVQKERMDGEVKPLGFFTQPLSRDQKLVYDVAKAQPELKNQEIANKLNMSINKVNIAISNVRRKGWDLPKKYVKFTPIILTQPPIIPREEVGDV